MAYLHLPRLTFSGDFVSDVSTVNNDVQHFNNETFEPSFQLPGQGGTNGWWNPEGGATFGFENCRVMRVTKEDGTVLADSSLDAIIGQFVVGGEGRNSGKMVDLDPDNQMVSALWGVTFRILNTRNELLLEGKVKPTSFRDLQNRQYKGGKVNGQPLGGSWSSVLEDVIWGEQATTSQFLTELRKKTHHNKISINLNGFGYYYNHNHGRFSYGRMLGSIGPWFENEPELFAPARRLYGVHKSGDSPRPPTWFGGSNFILDETNGHLAIDLGSSFPVCDSLGNIDLSTQFHLAISNTPITYSPSDCPSGTKVLLPESSLSIINQIPYLQQENWLNQTSGIVDFFNLSKDIVESLKNRQLLLVASNKSSEYLLIAREAINGFYCRADNFVQRIDTNQSVTINIYAYQYGQPLVNQIITLKMQPPGPTSPKADNNPPICDIYGNNDPQDGLTFAQSCVTNENGLAQITITGNSINKPRHYIDGQIYWIDYDTSGTTSIDPAIPGVFPMSITAHLRDDFSIPKQPVWSDISPIMIQFANLYPIMSKFFINFADPTSVIAKKEILKFAFTRDITDPIYMPVTRDLSENKRLTILKWLDNPIIDEPTAMNADKEIRLAPALTSETGQLTDQQVQLRAATRLKNGSEISCPEITDLFQF
jgi:hypothetical protein